MKRAVFIVLSLLGYMNLFGQTNKDSSVIQYLAARPYYILITDSLNIPEKLKPYYGIMLDYLAEHKMVKSDYYVNSTRIREENNSLIVPISNYETFAFGANWIGNPSGKDGFLKINTKRKKVVWFKLAM